MAEHILHMKKRKEATKVMHLNLLVAKEIVTYMASKHNGTGHLTQEYKFRKCSMNNYTQKY